MERRSELELLILGIVWKQGPCTAHAVRMEFTHSPSSHWSGSAGAIYPAVKRLLGQGLLQADAGQRGRQRRELLRVTAAGRAALRAWLKPPFDEAAFSAVHDPLRTRFYFLGLLPVDQQRKVLDAWEAGLTAQMSASEALRDHYQDKGWLHSALANEGALLMRRAQLEWITAARALLDELGGSRE